MLSRIIRLNAHRTGTSAGAAAAAATAAFRVRRPAQFPNASPVGAGGVGGCFGSGGYSDGILRGGLSSSSSLRTAARGVQFEQTSETIDGINKKNRAQTTKWVTKSTKDYMQEADKKIKGAASLTNVGRERIKESSAARRELLSQVQQEGEAKFQLEMDRIRDDDDSRWRKGINFFKRQGKSFVGLYLFVYVASFLTLYAGFTSGFLKKEAAFEFMFILFGNWITQEKFYERIESWDIYVNFGFAFVINEVLEVFRLPFVMFIFYQCRPLLTGIVKRGRKSIFRWNAAEA